MAENTKDIIAESAHEETTSKANDKEALKENDTKANENESQEAEEGKEVEKEEVKLSKEEQLELEVQQQKEKYLRLFAEFENFRKRTAKERIELFKTASQDVMQSMLPVMDDFDRASKEINKSDDKPLVEGVNLIYNKLKEALKSKGLEVMNVNAGDSFDADLHEAVTQIPAPDKKMKGKIIDVLEKGYTLGDKIIRFPKVVTGK